MQFRTWHVAAFALVGLLALTAVFGVITARRSSASYVRLDEHYRHYRDVEVQLHQLRADVYLSGIFIRDYLLDTAPARDAAYRTRLVQYRDSNLKALEQLRGLLPDRADAREGAMTLQASLEEYWKIFDPVFDWTPAEKATRSVNFLKHEVVPRREAVLTIARDIEELNSASLELENQEATRQYTAHLGDMQSLLWRTLGLGFVVAVIAVNRFRVLEHRAEAQQSLAEAAEARMRVLSNELVATQEEERKKLSRELHDHIGQMLTGLRMELGRIERLATGAGLTPALADSRSLVDEVMRTVRDLAMGLRPSMLDDFGLQPALEWLVRDFSRRSGLHVTVKVSEGLDGLPEPYRTCVFRAVQEALTNCGRHSAASQVSVEVSSGARELTVTVHDNGVGLAPNRRGTGLGLRGIEERAKELNGTVTIETGHGAGTTMRISMPLPVESEVNHADPAR